eukprot:2908371-Pyramimonas_sp.AAC.1
MTARTEKPLTHADRVGGFARASRMEGGPCSNGGSRLSAARIRLKHMKQFHGWRTFFNMRRLFQPRAH